MHSLLPQARLEEITPRHIGWDSSPRSKALLDLQISPVFRLIFAMTKGVCTSTALFVPWLAVYVLYHFSYTLFAKSCREGLGCVAWAWLCRPIRGVQSDAITRHRDKRGGCLQTHTTATFLKVHNLTNQLIPRHDFPKLWQIKAVSPTVNLGQDPESEGVQMAFGLIKKKFFNKLIYNSARLHRFQG